MNFGVIFLTGLTTGGLTCLAIQGGLLATTLARPVSVTVPSRRPGSPQGASQSMVGIQLVQNLSPVVYFMLAKLLAHTVLGFGLGALGSVVQITPLARAIMQLLAGGFMVATALNMFNAHPIFRYIALQPPKRLTRLVRNQAKSTDLFAPVVLGVLTLLIPCGTTQAMEVLAISSGSPLLGALIMFVFVLGTSPTFLILGVLATRLRGSLHTIFAISAAVAIFLLGIAAIDGGLNLLGSPLAPSRIVATVFQPSRLPEIATLARAADVNGVQELVINAQEYGYAPSYATAQKGKPIRLRLQTTNSFSCTRSFVIPSLGIQQILPETGETVIDLPAQGVGILYYTCGMGMYGGAILFQ
jgi:uncharacterized protein